ITADNDEFEPNTSAQRSASRERRSRRSRKSTLSEDLYESSDTTTTTTKSLVGPFRTCYDILQQIKKHQWSWPFAEPVDVQKLGIEDYFLIIKKPMDLGTVHTKLTTGQYETVYDFADDMN